uniref:Uncharacterized protein n=1 Tax=Anopheles darlingi TaxID=43151 RepID=A0A2M4DLY4_ANODA
MRNIATLQGNSRRFVRKPVLSVMFAFLPHCSLQSCSSSSSSDSLFTTGVSVVVMTEYVFAVTGTFLQQT